MSSSGLVQGETLLLHDKRNIQVFYKLVTLSLLKNFTPKLLVDFLSNHFKQDTSYGYIPRYCKHWPRENKRYHETFQMAGIPEQITTVWSSFVQLPWSRKDICSRFQAFTG